MKLTKVLFGISAALAAVFATPASAQLTGKTIGTTDFHGTAPDTTIAFGPLNRVVGPGIEVTTGLFSDFATVDFSDASVRIVAVTDQPFGFFELLRFTDPDGAIPSFLGVTIDPATNYAGFDASRISVGPDVIDLTLTGLEATSGQQIVLNFEFGPVAAVPEPASSALLFAGLAAAMATRRAQRRKAPSTS